MKKIKMKQRPIKLPDADKTGLRTQFGALCYRVRKDKLQVLMITSRNRKRWIVPKGWPMDKMTPAEAAAREAFEEAGAEGKISPHCLGIYTASKAVNGDSMPFVVALYPLEVKRLHAIFPERGQRRRRWMSLKRAAQSVNNPELAQLIRSFKPVKKT